MTKTYHVHVGCADCAAKIEKAIEDIDGVEKARVNFMTQKLKLTADEARIGAIVEEAAAVGDRIEPGFAIEC